MTHNFALERVAGRIFAAFWWVPESGHSSRSAWGRDPSIHVGCVCMGRQTAKTRR
jgi:hypothetical protein